MAKRKSAARKKGKAKSILPFRIGVLHSGLKSNFEDLVEDMKNAAVAYLRHKGSNADIEIHGGGSYANDKIRVLENLAEQLVNRTDVDVIVAAGGPQSAVAAMDATNEADGPRSETPVVFTTVADPVGLGLVDSLKTPGGNLTGMAGRTSESDPLRLGFLKAYVAPFKPASAKKVGVLVNPGRQGYPKQYRELKEKAKGMGLKLVARRANDAAGIARAFEKFRGPNFLGAVVTADAFFNNNRALIIEEAAMYGGVPVIYQWEQFVVDGGLMSYGPSIKYAYEEAGRYVAQILLKEKEPKDMGCSTPGPFELFIKESTADALGLLPIPNTIAGEKPTVIP